MIGQKSMQAITKLIPMPEKKVRGNEKKDIMFNN